jgi:hypothetical protein
LLNGEIFYTLKEAQVIIEHWRNHYNTRRPHSALGYRPPAPEVVIPNEGKRGMEKGQTTPASGDEVVKPYPASGR